MVRAMVKTGEAGKTFRTHGFESFCICKISTRICDAATRPSLSADRRVFFEILICHAAVSYCMLHSLTKKLLLIDCFSEICYNKSTKVE